MVTGQLSVANQDTHVLFDSGATHSFASHTFARKLTQFRDRINQTFKTALPSRQTLLSSYWLRHVPIIIAGRELFVNLVILEMFDYDIILGMDFLGKYNANIECQARKVTFKPDGAEEFEYVNISEKQPRMMISAMRARRMLHGGCVGYLANIIDTTKEE